MPSRPARLVYMGLGFVFVGLGAIGTVLPILPTTPFLLLAAACWARSSERFLDWLHAHRVFGPTLRTWHHHRSLPPGVKGKAIVLVTVTLALSAVFGVHTWPLRAALALTGAALVVFLARLPVHHEGAGESGAPAAAEIPTS